MVEKDEKKIEEDIAKGEEVKTETISGATKEEDKGERSSLENLRVLENIDVKLTVEVGGAEIKLRELLRIIN